jgi:hypothetical protein
VTHPLDGVRLKLERAKAQRRAIRYAHVDFLDEHRYRTVFETERGEDWQPGWDAALRFVADAEPSPYIGLLVGEYIHSLRSVLDHLVYQLAYREEPEADLRRVQFPIFDDPTEYAKPRGKNPSFRETMLGPMPVMATALRNIRELDNRDKHRLLIPTYTHVGKTSAELLRGGASITVQLMVPWGAPIRPGDLVLGVVVNGKDGGQIQLTSGVVCGLGVGGLEIAGGSGLNDLYGEVENIFRAIEPFFD